MGWFVWIFGGVRRRRADFLSGQMERVERAVEEEVVLGQVPANYVILAMVGLGNFDGARRALLAGPPPTDSASAEIRLCARVVIEAFEGKPSQALALCRDLLSSAASDQRSQVRRQSAIAIARISAGVGDEDDLCDLSLAPAFEPALVWVCRYAVVLEHPDASTSTHPMFQAAPVWPAHSHFYSLQNRLMAVDRRYDSAA